MYADKRSLAHDIHRYAYHLLNLLNKVRPNVRFTHKYYDEFVFFLNWHSDPFKRLPRKIYLFKRYME